MIRDDDFFGAQPEPPPEPQRRVEPPWFGAPRGTLPGVVALELVLARSSVAAVCVTRVAAYRTGFEFDLLTVSDPDAAEALELDPYLFGPHRRRAQPGDADTRLRLGVEYADGAKATNVGAGSGVGGHDEEPQGPVLHGQSGGGGGGRWRQSFWVWPLPPVGQLTFVCEWPAASIPVTRHAIDARVVLEASRRAQPIFADGPRSGDGTWTSFVIGTRAPDARDRPESNER